MKRSIMTLAGVATVFMVGLIDSSMVQDVVITVDPTRTYQTMILAYLTRSGAAPPPGPAPPAPAAIT
jgi:hypothetical protein